MLETPEDSGKGGEALSSTRVCDVCKEPLPLSAHPLRKYHLACASVRMQEQLEELAKKRKGSKQTERVVKCVCGVEFLAKTHREKYCSDLCRGQGLLAAVERQRVRREIAKQQKRDET